MPVAAWRGDARPCVAARPPPSRRAYVPFEHVMAHLVGRRVVFEHRPTRYMFGARNYGEVVGWRNRADGDCWDVFAPGYERRLPMGRAFAVGSVLGVLLLDNGNHKIAVRLRDDDAEAGGYDAARAAAETARYCRTYTARNRRVGTYAPLAPF